jgi:hypothetical protein
MAIDLTAEQVEAAEDSPWTPEETALLAGRVFSQLDDTDYSEYLKPAPDTRHPVTRREPVETTSARRLRRAGRGPGV